MQDSLDILRTDYNSEDFIEHHGIKGMKWGVRRFQPYPKGYHGKEKYLNEYTNKL